jgi:hypothetical protein
MSAPRLRTRRARRLATAAVVGITAMLGSLVPPSLHGLGILAVLVLAGLDVLLVQGTDGLAFARRRTLDERERALRDLAYRRGFRLLGLAAILEVVLLAVTAIVSTLLPHGQWLGTTVVNDGVGGRALVALAELLLMTPTLVIAWVGPDREDVQRRSRTAHALWFPVPVLAGLWLVLLALAPAQVATASANTSSASLVGATCQQFSAGRIVGAEFGAAVGMRVEVCWNGHDAFVLGDPGIPLPPSVIAAYNAQVPADAQVGGTDAAMFNPAQPDLTGCGRDNIDDFATIASTVCTARIDAAGTLHYVVKAVVSGPLGIGRRDVRLTLVVNRNGKVLQSP